MQENNPTRLQSRAHDEPSSIALEDYYSEIGVIRNICFVWLDRKRIFCNYSYLVCYKYALEKSKIIILFTTQLLIKILIFY